MICTLFKWLLGNMNRCLFHSYPILQTKLSITLYINDTFKSVNNNSLTTAFRRIVAHLDISPKETLIISYLFQQRAFRLGYNMSPFIQLMLLIFIYQLVLEIITKSGWVYRKLCRIKNGTFDDNKQLTPV